MMAWAEVGDFRLVGKLRGMKTNVGVLPHEPLFTAYPSQGAGRQTLSVVGDRSREAVASDGHSDLKRRPHSASSTI